MVENIVINDHDNPDLSELALPRKERGEKIMMAKSFMPTITTKEELKNLQLKGLLWSVNHAYQGSGFYRKRFDEAKVKPDDIHSLVDI